jgi:hypothetical protein
MKNILLLVVLFTFLFGCAWIPARKALDENINAPPGKIEGNRFTGIRYPFTVSAPPNWEMTMEFPDFMEELGYDRPFSTDKEQTELYVYNPETKSNVSFDFTPAGPYVRFNQKGIEQLTESVTGQMKSDLAQEFGKGIKVDVGPTEPLSLGGIQYAAKKYVAYPYKGSRREQGWIYAFTEPYQVFILYTILEKEGTNDRQDMKKILDSFDFPMKK